MTEGVAYRPLGRRFLKIALSEGGENDVADGRSLSGDGRQRNLQAAPLPPSARAILYCAGGRLQMGGEGGHGILQAAPLPPWGRAIFASPYKAQSPLSEISLYSLKIQKNERERWEGSRRGAAKPCWFAHFITGLLPYIFCICTNMLCLSIYVAF